MTITDTTTASSRDAEQSTYRLPAVDLYRDIHKGIRAELFAITTTAGSLDPADRADRVALLDHITSMAGVLASHAHHEDAFIDPALERHAPDLAERINADHIRIERTFDDVVALATDVVNAPVIDQHRLVHMLYLDLAAFTGEYLVHQELEERLVMPALERAVGVEAVAQINAAIVGSIPPDEMARSLAFMLPAMNPSDRAELLGGIRAAAPRPAFDAVVGLARSVLTPAGFDALSKRLAIA